MKAQAYFDYSGTPKGPGSAWAVVVDLPDQPAALRSGGLFHAQNNPETQACRFAAQFLRARGITEAVLWTDEIRTKNKPPAEARGFEVRVISRNNALHQRAHDLAGYLRKHGVEPEAGMALHLALRTLPAVDPGVLPQFSVKKLKNGRKKLKVLGMTLSGSPKKVTHTLRKVSQLFGQHKNVEQIVQQAARLLNAPPEALQMVLWELGQGEVPAPPQTRLDPALPSPADQAEQAPPSQVSTPLKQKIHQQLRPEPKLFKEIQRGSRASMSYVYRVVAWLVGSGEAEIIVEGDQRWVRTIQPEKDQAVPNQAVRPTPKLDTPTATEELQVKERVTGPKKELRAYLNIGGRKYRVSESPGRQRKVTERVLRHYGLESGTPEAQALRAQIQNAFTRRGLRTQADTEN